MRDDLHKGAPLRPHWRSVIRRIARDADWKSGAPRAIEHALMKDARAILADVAVDRLVKAVESRQGLLLSLAELVRAEHGNELSEPFRHHLVLHHADGLRGQDLKRAALGDALAEHISAHRKEILAHVATKDMRCVREVASRFDQAAMGTLGKVSQSVVSGESTRRTELGLDLDSDLRGGIS